MASVGIGKPSHRCDEWVSSMVMHYHQTGRRLHGETQSNVNAMAQVACQQVSGQWAAHEEQQQGQVQPGDDVRIGINAVSPGAQGPMVRPEILMTPQGRPMAMSSSRGRLLHRAESGRPMDGELVHVLDGRHFIRSPIKGQSEWLDMLVNGQVDAWPSPPPESPVQEMARQAMAEAFAMTTATAEAKAVAE